MDDDAALIRRDALDVAPLAEAHEEAEHKQRLGPLAVAAIGVSDRLER